MFRISKHEVPHWTRMKRPFHACSGRNTITAEWRDFDEGARVYRVRGPNLILAWSEHTGWVSPHPMLGRMDRLKIKPNRLSYWNWMLLVEGGPAKLVAARIQRALATEKSIP